MSAPFCFSIIYPDKTVVKVSQKQKNPPAAKQVDIILISDKSVAEQSEMSMSIYQSRAEVAPGFFLIAEVLLTELFL